MRKVQARTWYAGVASPPPSEEEVGVCESNVTASLGGKTALFLPGYECNSSVAARDFDRLISEDTALLQTVLLGDPHCTSDFDPPYIGTPPYSDHLIGGSPTV